MLSFHLSSSCATKAKNCCSLEVLNIFLFLFLLANCWHFFIVFYYLEMRQCSAGKTKLVVMECHIGYRVSEVWWYSVSNGRSSCVTNDSLLLCFEPKFCFDGLRKTLQREHCSEEALQASFVKDWSVSAKSEKSCRVPANVKKNKIKKNFVDRSRTQNVSLANQAFTRSDKLMCFLIDNHRCYICAS